MKELFLLGWHGTANIGDDLMAILFIDNVKEKYQSIYSFERFYQLKNNIVLPKFKAIIKMFTADELMISGGNIFLISSKKSYIKLTLFFVVFLIRKILNKPTLIDSIGLDLKIGKVNRYILLKILSQVNSISIREPLSYRYLRYIKFYSKYFYDIKLNYDRVYRYEDCLYKKYNLPKNPNALVWFISGQPAEKHQDTFNKTIVLIKQLFQYKLNNVNINFFCQNKNDIKRVYEILENTSLIKEYKIITYDYNNIDEQIKIIASSNYAIVERYHGAILSEIFHLKWYKLAFSEKLERAYLPNKYCENCDKKDK